MKPQIAKVAPVGVICVGYSRDTFPMFLGNNGDLMFDRPLKASNATKNRKFTTISDFFTMLKAMIEAKAVCLLELA